MTTTDDGTETDVLWDGFIAGTLGAVAVALWFLLLDLAAGHPLHTPTLLGKALFSGSSSVTVDHADSGTVALYSLVHLGGFVAAGAFFTWLAGRLEARPRGLLLLAVALVVAGVAGFVAFTAGLPALEAKIPGWSVLAANLLAAAGMGYYLALRHPGLTGGERPRGLDG